MSKRSGACSFHGTLLGSASAALAFTLLGACAGTAGSIVPDASAARAAGVPKGAHELTCHYGTMQATQGVRDVNSDVSTLSLVVTFPEANTPPPRKVLSPAVQVQRTRRGEPYAEVGLLPQSACAPEVHPVVATVPGPSS